MPTLDWNKWADGWSAGFPKNSMWGAIRSGENDPETGEPLYRFNDKPSTASMSPELADVMNEHRFVAPAIVDNGQDEHCFCGWVGEHWGDHYQEQLAAFAGDHNAPVDNSVESEDAEETGHGRRPGGSGLEKDDAAHKADEDPKPAKKAPVKSVKATEVKDEPELKIETDDK